MRLPALLGLAMLAAPALHAQTDSVSLSLNQAVRLAEENNPTYRRALTEVGTARADVRRARGAFLPSLNLSLGAGGNYSRTFTGIDPFGEPVIRDEAVESKNSSAQQSLSISSFTLVDGGQRRRDLLTRPGG